MHSLYIKLKNICYLEHEKTVAYLTDFFCKYIMYRLLEHAFVKYIVVTRYPSSYNKYVRYHNKSSVSLFFVSRLVCELIKKDCRSKD